MFEKILMIALFFAVTVGIGVYCRRHAGNVGDFVLGGRNVGPWVTAFAYGTSYFSSVVFVGYAGQFGWKWGIAAGVIHASVVLNTGFLHGGLNLYNNGFSAGLVCIVLVPLIEALRRDRE